MEVVEAGQTPTVPAPVGQEATATAPAGGLRFAEDLAQPKEDVVQPKKAKKGKPISKDGDEPVKAKKAAKKGRRLAVVEEDEEDYDMEFNLEDFGWKDEEETAEAPEGEAETS
jgi:hypothetical protein